MFVKLGVMFKLYPSARRRLIVVIIERSCSCRVVGIMILIGIFIVGIRSWDFRRVEERNRRIIRIVGVIAVIGEVVVINGGSGRIGGGVVFNVV